MRVRFAAVLAAITVFLAANGAQAREGDKSIEGTLNFGSEAFDGLGWQLGPTLGFGYELRGNLQARADLSYFRSSSAKGDMDLTGTRVPLDLGARYYLPFTTPDKDLTFFGQGGLEVSFDRWHRADSSTRSDTRLGGLLGGGAEYSLAPHFGAIANAQFHLIEDSFFSTGVGMAYHF